MTISNAPRRAGPYLGNDTGTSFAFLFKVFDKTNIQVVLVDDTGSESTLVLDSDYSVTVNADQTNSPGGAVTYPISGDPLPTGSSLTIIGALPYSQQLTVPTGGKFLASVLEGAGLDPLSVQIQQLAEVFTRCIKLPASFDGDGTVPEASVRAGMLYGFDDDGNPALAGPASGSAAALALALAAVAGAGLLGYAPGTSYAVGTIGATQTGVLNMAAISGIDRTGVSDSTSAINNASLLCKRMYFPSGTYLINFAQLRTDCELFGDGDSTILRPLTTSTAAALSFDSGSADPANNITNVYVHDLQLRGWSDTAGLSQHLHLLSLNGVTRALFERVTFRAARGDGAFVGSSQTGGQERHNFDITFRKCVFDGVNHSGRNGVTVEDCVRLRIDDCLFVNLSDPTMPGAIDVEPNNGWNVTTDLHVEGNSFIACGGAAGCFAIQYGNLGTTTPPTGIRFKNNVVDSAGYTSDREKGVYVSLYGDATSATFPLDMEVSGNTFRNVVNPIRLDGVSGVRFRHNSVLTTLAEGRIGPTYKCIGVDIHDNYFYQLANDVTSGGNGLSLFTASLVSIRRNRFVNAGKSDGSLGYCIHLSTGTTDNLYIEDNVATGANTTMFVESIGTQTPATNVLRGNEIGTLDASQFLAGYGSKTWALGTVTNGTTVQTNVTATGARFGRKAFAALSASPQGATVKADVSAADTITVTVTNNSGGSAVIGTVTVTAWADPA